ncbi:MAG: hypothetical protein LBE84_11750 [Planctomycetota bacterium]|jgi:phosphopantothenoylcysteine decarboxylase/phosphopantothenate--cysteine ligase|nr:hypothetical protein [Planctomycetota bacterium]
MRGGEDGRGGGSGIRILITGGPTVEDIDPVRFLGNRSTGRMGIALARTAVALGLEARLILGPTHLAPPPEVETIGIRSAGEMLQAVLANFSWCDALVMAAAVADYTPVQPMKGKIKKNGADFILRLKRTEDILFRVGRLPERRGKCLIGFSLDVGENVEEGRRKLREKGLDMVLVNSVAAFGAQRVRSSIVSLGGEEDLGELDKEELADILFARAIRFFDQNAWQRTATCQA